MKTPRWLIVLLVVAVAISSGWLGSPRQTQAQTLGLGNGARFLPADTAFYLAGNFGPHSPQLAYLDRLTQFYVSAPQLDSARREFSRTLRPFGPYRDLGELWADASPWLGDEAFIAFRSRQDLLDASGVAAFSNRVDVNCREEQLLAGVAIGDQAAFRDFLQRYDESLARQGIFRSTEQIAGTEVLVIGGSPEGGNIFATVKDGYLLLSTSYGLLSDALNGQANGGGLAATEGFRTARTRVGADALALMYVSVPDQTLGFGGAGLFQEGSTQWIAGGLRLAADSVRVDVTAALDPSRLTPGTLAAFGKTPNPLRAAAVAPRQTSFFVGWDNLKLIWETIKEQIGEDSYTAGRQEFIANTGIDPDADIFDWMTGEFALYASPSANDDGLLGRLGLGMLVQARDPGLARAKLDKVLQAIEKVEPNMKPTKEDIAGVSFARIPLSGRDVLYTQVVGDWLMIASDSQVVQDTLAGLKGDGGLQTQPEASIVRAPLPDPLQFYGYINMPQFVAVTTSSVGAAGASAQDASEAAEYSQPIRSVGLGIHTTHDQVQGTFFAHVAMPEPRAAPAPAEEEQVSPTWYSTSVLIDASKAGGAWWGPDQEPADVTVRSSDVPLALPEHGAALARFLHDEGGISNLRTLLPGERVGQPPEGAERSADRVYGNPVPNADGILTPSAPAVLRIGSEGAYDPDEVVAYEKYVGCGGKLLLLSDGKAPGEADELAAAFGMQVAGTARGEATISQFEPHTLTEGAEPLSASGGTGLTAWDEWTTPVAFYSAGSYLDLDGNGRAGVGDIWGAPAMAIRPYGRGVVVFLGTTSIVQQPTDALPSTMLHLLLPDAHWTGPIPPDSFEPDDTPDEASRLVTHGSGPVPVIRDDVITHSLDSPTDIDWYQFEGEENDNLTVGTYSCTLNLTLIDADGGTEIVTADGLVLAATLPYTGSYFVRVTPRPAPWDTCRDYQLSARLTPAAPQPEPESEDTTGTVSESR